MYVWGSKPLDRNNSRVLSNTLGEPPIDHRQCAKRDVEPFIVGSAPVTNAIADGQDISTDHHGASVPRPRNWTDQSWPKLALALFLFRSVSWVDIGC
jgi:hypothetical protein